MDIILKAVFFIPAALCAYWILSFLLTKRGDRENLFMIGLIFFEPYFVAYAFFCMPDTDYIWLAQLERIGLPFVFMGLGIIIVYLFIHMIKRSLSPFFMLFLAPGMMYGAMLNTLYYIIGVKAGADYQYLVNNGTTLPKWYHNTLYETFHFVDKTLPMYLASMYVVFLIGQCIHILYEEGYRFGNFTKFMFMGYRANQTRMIALFLILLLITFIPVIALGPKYMTTHGDVSLVLTLVMSFILYILCDAEYHNNMDVFTLKNLFNSKSYYESKLQNAKLLAELRQEAELMEAKNLERSYKERRRIELVSQFRTLMEKDEMYRDSDINIMEIAGKLNIGRTTLSTIINQAYGKNFRSVINDYRIEYSKKYMKDNPNYTIEQIAFQCGFKDASAFSHKFKELMGQPPLTWLMAQG